MANKVKAVIYLTVLYRLIMGEWPDTTDPNYQRAVEECLANN